jgi:hypothetical protein
MFIAKFWLSATCTELRRSAPRQELCVLLFLLVAGSSAPGDQLHISSLHHSSWKAFGLQIRLPEAF